MSVLSMFVGTLTRFSESRGVHVLDLEDRGDAGVEMRLRHVLPADDPTWVLTSPDGSTLYALGHRSFVGDVPGAPVTAWRSDTLEPLGVRHLPFTHASHATFDHTGRWLFVACTLGGGFVVLPIADDGTLGAPTAAVAHRGPAMVPYGTSEIPPVIPAPGSPMPHAVVADPTNSLLVVPDMGLDVLELYRFDQTDGSVEHAGTIAMPPGGEGPRHGSFIHDGALLFVVNELGSSVATVAIDVTDATGEIVSLLPVERDPVAGNKPSGIVLDPDRPLIHMANRGRDDITTYTCPPSGVIEQIAATPCGGTEPRGIASLPERNLVFVANEHSHDVIAHRVGPDGLLAGIVGRVDVQGATAIAFGRPRAGGRGGPENPTN